MLPLTRRGTATHLLLLVAVAIGGAVRPAWAEEAPSRRIAVLLLASGELDPELADNLTEVLIAAVAEGTPNAHIVGKEEFQAILQTQDQESLQCLESAACLGRVGVEVGVSEVISGVVGPRPEGYALSVIRTDIASGRVLGRCFEEVDGDVRALLAAVRSCAAPLLGGEAAGHEDPPVTASPPPPLTAEPTEPAGRPRFRRTGLVIELGVGAAGATDDDHLGDDVDLDPLVGFPALAVLYRPIDWVSAGLTLQYSFLGVASTAIDAESAGVLSTALGARLHLPLGRIEPWIGVGLAYVMHHAAGEGRWWWGNGEGTMWLHGLGIDVTAGLSVFTTERLAITAFGRFVASFWLRTCYHITGTALGGRVDEDKCETIEEFFDDPRDPTDGVPDMPHFWQAGVAISYTAL